MANSKNTGRSSINISLQTKDALDSIKRAGQSYNGLIQELVKFWKQEKGENWTQRREKSGRL